MFEMLYDDKYVCKLAQVSSVNMVPVEYVYKTKVHDVIMLLAATDALYFYDKLFDKIMSSSYTSVKQCIAAIKDNYKLIIKKPISKFSIANINKHFEETQVKITQLNTYLANLSLLETVA